MHHLALQGRLNLLGNVSSDLAGHTQQPAAGAGGPEQWWARASRDSKGSDQQLVQQTMHCPAAL